jgi:hypothetical protein
MSSFDDLPTMTFGAEPGYQARQRVEVSGVPVHERDAQVIAAGGRIIHQSIESKGLRPGRYVAPVDEASYYLIPDDAFDA